MTSPTTTTTTTRGHPSLVVGPLLRYADEDSATIWVEADRPCTVTVAVDDSRFAASTWEVHGHHFALVVIDGLQPASTYPYEVTLDGAPVWPEDGSPYPPSSIRTPDPDAVFSLAFVSCRRSDPLDHQHLRELGADALVALAERMATEPIEQWPDVLLMLGDQVYADEPSAAIRERLRHDPVAPRDAGLHGEIRNFREYAWLYEEAWMPPPIRWLLSTVPVAMLLDDHDLRDDWNTSQSWRDRITREPWWRDRVVSAYGSYWVYQHLGNLSPDQLAEEPTYAAMLRLETNEARTAYLDEFAWRADVDPTLHPLQLPPPLGEPARRGPVGRHRLAQLPPARPRRPSHGRRRRVGVGLRCRAARPRRRSGP